MSHGHPPIPETDNEWRKKLTAEQYRVLRCHGTECAGSHPLHLEKRTGNYLCAGCGTRLFSSDTKFDSGTGWPSFWDYESDSVEKSEDTSHGMIRTEVHCAKCGGHLGHVFDDGPMPSSLRYCINGAALQFVPQTEDSKNPSW